jgi:hypothetical protein
MQISKQDSAIITQTRSVVKNPLCVEANKHLRKGAVRKEIKKIT